jgi:hypothetical protein
MTAEMEVAEEVSWATKGKCCFQRFDMGEGFGPRSGTHRMYLGNPRRPIGSLAAWELDYPESIKSYGTSLLLKKQDHLCQKVTKSAFSQVRSWFGNIIFSDVTRNSPFLQGQMRAL